MKELYAATEQYKNASFNTTKYEPRTVTGPVPHIVIFSNILPKVDGLSFDRWRFCRITDSKELVLMTDHQKNLLSKIIYDHRLKNKIKKAMVANAEVGPFTLYNITQIECEEFNLKSEYADTYDEARGDVLVDYIKLDQEEKDKLIKLGTKTLKSNGLKLDHRVMTSRFELPASFVKKYGNLTMPYSELLVEKACLLYLSESELKNLNYPLKIST
jgi:hypothetical protein